MFFVEIKAETSILPYRRQSLYTEPPPFDAVFLSLSFILITGDSGKSKT